MKKAAVQMHLSFRLGIVSLLAVLFFSACSPAAPEAATQAAPIPTEEVSPQADSASTEEAAPQVTSVPTEEAAPQVTPEVGAYIGDLVNPPVQLQDFTMASSTGQNMSLSDFDGQWRLIFFGYLHCPDFCPLTLAEYRQIKALLGDDAQNIEFLYISVDGARDTPEAMRDYLDNFDPAFIGLSGDDEILARIQPDYGFYYRRQLTGGSQARYTVDHSTRTYLVDPSGQLRATFTYDITPSNIASAIQWHMRQQEGNLT
ncbi:MAG: SCO family protein [Anaerolineae bacterium]|nr:SCO family protein [Anaerolineae bacterium]